MNENTSMLRPVEHELRRLRRALDEHRLVRAADADGALTELDAVLRQKRGCRR